MSKLPTILERFESGKLEDDLYEVGYREDDFKKIGKVLYDNDVYMYTPRRGRHNGGRIHPLMRLTVIFFIIVMLFSYLAIPIMYLLNGRYGYDPNNKFYIFMDKWEEKLRG